MEKVMTKELCEKVRKYYRKNWYINFKYKEFSEILEYFKLEFMLEFYELSENLSNEELVNLYHELKEIVVLWDYELRMKKVTNYSMVNRIYVKYELLQDWIYAHQMGPDAYEVFDKYGKQVLDRKGYVRLKNQKTIKEARKKESKAS